MRKVSLLTFHEANNNTLVIYTDKSTFQNSAMPFLEYSIIDSESHDENVT